MNINVNIERLILDGMSVPHAERPLLQAALEVELARLLAVDGLAPNLLEGGTQARINAGSMEIDNNSNYTQMGQNIAQAVYRGMGL
ncbi:MAG: hypothetical protein HC836_14155 [Richelia sp. RM2_1_2]|nr:hypothetical protein [Candidatus Methylacidiphilales bacterium]NJN06629.1 hypothetical protein [Richelia sp. RM1_1_1]NJO27183.1 hypothetical protein [Richelia sp. SL_2_1]NJO59401.1 hypothetical protein [Richelia sp. RM2_1_2]NJR19934.1 hypothetical protein [Calothrix sp. CSU_2_0]